MSQGGGYGGMSAPMYAQSSPIGYVGDTARGKYEAPNLENRVQATPVMHNQHAVEVINLDYRRPTPTYDPKDDYHASPSWFLNPQRQELPVVNNSTDVMPLVEQTFSSLTDKDFPKNIKLSVVDSQTLKTIHEKVGSTWSDGIQGFSLNRWGNGVSEIFVREAPMDKLMLTIGHEIGHVLTPSLPNAQDEEAKAFAFSIAWVETIKEHNIGHIGGNFAERPAENGLHDVGFKFVRDLLKKGKKAVDIYVELVKKMVTIQPKKEIITL